MSLLAEIVDTKRQELPALRRRALPQPPPTRSVSLHRVAGEPLRLLTEFKRRSPSAGELSTALTLAQRVATYARGGAHVISVLCDKKYFDGDYDDLRVARDSCDVPLLCKEFIVDECQLDAARAYGADAALLIARCVTEDRLHALVQACRERELLPLVEVYTQEECDSALRSGAELIGVNARNLDTLQLNVQEAERILTSLPASITRAHLSGLSRAEAVAAVAAGPADAALIGEALMRQDDPTDLLRRFIAAAHTARNPG